MRNTSTPSSSARLGVADHGEVLVVDLGLLQELLALLTGDGWQRALLDRERSLAEATDHGIDVERGHDGDSTAASAFLVADLDGDGSRRTTVSPSSASWHPAVARSLSSSPTSSTARRIAVDGRDGRLPRWGSGPSASADWARRRGDCWPPGEACSHSFHSAVPIASNRVPSSARSGRVERTSQIVTISHRQCRAPPATRRARRSGSGSRNRRASEGSRRSRSAILPCRLRHDEHQIRRRAANGATLGAVPDIVWIILPSAVMIGMAIVALRIEPHWSSKDGRASSAGRSCSTRRHQPVGRWREVRGDVEGEDIVVRTRSLISDARSQATGSVYARGAIDERKRHVLPLALGDTSDQQLALRMPATATPCRCSTPCLPLERRAVLGCRSERHVRRGTARSDRRSDRG